MGNELWAKGATSGDVLDLVEVRCNCEQNSLVYLVRPRRYGACHTKKNGISRRSCYYRRLSPSDSGPTSENGNGHCFCVVASLEHIDGGADDLEGVAAVSAKRART